MSPNNGYGENIEEYEVLGMLGKGGFATVYRARSKRNNETVAIKMIDKKLIHSAGITNRVRQEVEIHSRLKHPFVVELYTFFQDADFVYLVMELANNGELHRYMKEHMGHPMTESEAAGILHQVVSGILYLHSHRIMHRDISLSNLLLNKNMDVKIADFGLAAQLKQSDEKHLTMCGTPNFISPEVASRSSHGLPADVWAVGCLLYTLLVGRPPFDTHAVQATLTKVVMSDYCLPEHLSYEAKDLINKLLKKDPNERIELQDIAKHPFMNRFKKSASTMGTYTNNNENGSTTALFQSSAASAYNNCSASSDSGIITFASSTSASSFRPTLKTDSRAYFARPIDNLATQNHNFNMFKSAPISTNDSNWQQKHASDGPQWHNQTQCKNVSLLTKQNENLFEKFAQTDGISAASQMIAGIPAATPTSTATQMFNKQEKRLTVPPLNTERLQPTRFRSKNAVMSILDGGEVVIEFIKFRGKLNQDRITDVCWISKDGQRIVIYEPDPGRGLPILDAPPELPQHDTHVGIFSYDNLPKKHWRKYLFASRFVSLVKASTPKVTLFSDQAKFHLMESMMHFEAIFYDNSKITQSPNEGLRIFDRNGRLLQPQEHSSPTATALLEHQAACLRRCEAICNALEMVQNLNSEGFSCFPVVIGRRPIRDRIGKVHHENMLIHDRNHYKSNQVSSVQPLSLNTYSSTPITTINNNTLPDCKNDNALPVKAITVPGVGKATELSNGIIHLQFYDGTLISVTCKSAAVRGDNRGITFMQPNGVATHFAPHDDLPLLVREKLSHLPRIEEQLKNTRTLNMATGGDEDFSGGDYFSTPTTSKSAKVVYTSTPASYSAYNKFEGSSSNQSLQAMRYFR